MASWPRVEVEAGRWKRQPRPRGSGGTYGRLPILTTRGPDRFARVVDELDLADEILFAEHFPGGVLGAVFEDGDELAVLGDRPPR